MPDPIDFFDSGVGARLAVWPMLARFPMEGNVSGHHKSPHRGSSVEFAEYRNYVPGDDIRRLDWRVFGRTDKFFLKEFEAETNLRCYFVVDTSRSMSFAGKNGSKLDFARRIVAHLSHLAIKQGDASGLWLVGEKGTKEIPARRNPAHLQLIFQSLQQIEPKGNASLASALHELAEKVRRRALIVVISDCFCELGPLMEAFQHLRFEKHDLVLFQMWDRAELDFQFDRPVRFADLESHYSLVTEPAMIREAYLEQVRAFSEKLQQGCTEVCADFRPVVTDQDYEKVLASFLVERARGMHPGR